MLNLKQMTAWRMKAKMKNAQEWSVPRLHTVCWLTSACTVWHLNISRDAASRSLLFLDDHNHNAYVWHLLLPRTSTVMLGPRALYSSGPASWNSLQTELRHPRLDTRHLQVAVEDSFVFVDVGLWIWSSCTPNWRIH